MVAAALVFFMQERASAFARTRRLTVRSKNSASIAIMSEVAFCDFCIASARTSGTFGFALMMGGGKTAAKGFIGLEAVAILDRLRRAVIWSRMVDFHDGGLRVGTAATIIAGAMAERIPMINAYFAYSFLVGAVELSGIYGHCGLDDSGHG